MTDIRDLPTIVTDNCFLDLDEGEQAVVRGRLETNYLGRLVVHVHSSWDLIVVDAPMGDRLNHLKGKDIVIIVERTEDGLLADEGAIHDCYEQGSTDG